MGVHEHNLADGTLVEAAGRLALAQAHLDLVLRLAITRLCSGSTPNDLDTMASSDLRSEVASQFRARCKDPQKRRKLRAMLLECERLADHRRRLLQAAWRLPENGPTQTEGPLLVSEPTTADSLSKLAADFAALTTVIDKARLHGFIARAADEKASSGPIHPAALANPKALAVFDLPPVLPPKPTIESRAIALRGQATLLQPMRSGRLAVVICPNCQTKVVST